MCFHALIEEKHACLSKEPYFYESTVKKLDLYLHFFPWYLNKRLIEDYLLQRIGNIFESLFFYSISARTNLLVK